MKVAFGISLSRGRAFMDMASGDSAVLNIGYGVATRARIEDYVSCVRGLLAAGEATYQGRPQRVRWASTVTRQRIPISICAEGPKMLHLGGRIGDGVTAGTGLLPDVIQDTIASVHAGAREAGRHPSDVDLGIKRIEQIADAGARKLWVSLRAADMDSQQHYMRILGEQIMSRFV